jgi:predicted dithiol-disulfide oxidoreductase (DUF899 family)
MKNEHNLVGQNMNTQIMRSGKTDSLSHHEIVSRADWLVARKDLLKREKELTRLRDQLSAERRALPWVKIDKEYIFDAPEGEVTLAELFDRRSQLFIKHFMLGPGQTTQCVGCSLEVDHIEGILPHLENHDVTYAVVARAPIEEIEAVRKRMGWRFRWVSSYHSDFNYDFNVSWTREQVASSSAFYGQANWKISRATACLIRMRSVRFSTRIRLSVAAAKSSSGSTEFWTRRRKGVKKMGLTTVSPIGRDLGTCTTKGERWKQTAAITGSPQPLEPL